MKEYTKLTDGYLYHFRNGRVKEYHGEVLYHEAYKNGHYLDADDSRFQILDDDGRKLKSVHCSEYEGVVSSNFLWLKERDFKKATLLFIDYHKTQIGRLVDRIDFHRENIALLETESES